MPQFSSFDLSLSAVLLTRHHHLMGGESDGQSNKILFYFLDSKELRNDVDTYYAAQLLVEPQRFFASLKVLKNLIHAHAETR